MKTWRKIIPALAGHKGHGPTFTPGDVVAMAIVAEFVRDFGIRIGTIADRLHELFQACHGRSWLSLESCIVVIDVESIRLIDAEAQRTPSIETTTIAVPCAPIIARLHSALTDTEADEPQGHLHFPPTAVTDIRERRRARA